MYSILFSWILVFYPKDSWQYLRFIFDKKLLFHQHIKFYTNKALFIVKYIKMLRNLIHGLLSYQKWLLYRTCVILIILYSFILWHYNKVPLSYLLNKLKKIWHWATLWILGIFHTSPTMRIKAIVGLIPILLYLRKLSSHDQL